MNGVVLLVVALLNVERVICGNVLAVFPTRNQDDFLIGEAVVNGLISNGHKAAVLSNFQPEESFYKHISLNDCELKDESNLELPYLADEEVHGEFLRENATCSCVLAGCDYSQLEEFDLLIVSMEYHSCFLRIGVPLNVPIIWIVATNQNLLANALTGDVDPLLAPITGNLLKNFIGFKAKLVSFWEYFRKFGHHFQMRSHAAVVNRKLFENVDPKATESVDFVFYNSHFTLFPRAHVPNVIEIAGVHIEAEKPICPRVGRFIDDAENGIIFISTPTDEPSKRMFEKKMHTFEISFLRVAQSVLWKRNTSLGIPNYNLFWSARLPQREILNHENVIVFIGCASLKNIYEAVDSATPFIGITCLAEQRDNIARLEELGVGISLAYDAVNEVTIVNAINLIWHDKSYAEKMQKLSTAFNDRTMTPLNTAVYWAEYAIRHNGASHMKSESAKMPLYRYLMLDTGSVSCIVGVLYLYYAMVLYMKLFFWLKPKMLRWYRKVRS